MLAIVQAMSRRSQRVMSVPRVFFGLATYFYLNPSKQQASDLVELALSIAQLTPFRVRFARPSSVFPTGPLSIPLGNPMTSEHVDAALISTGCRVRSLEEIRQADKASVGDVYGEPSMKVTVFLHDVNPWQLALDRNVLLKLVDRLQAELAVYKASVTPTPIDDGDTLP